MKFIIASNNSKKIVELNRILIPLGIEAVTADMIGQTLDDVKETGTTFLENARLKAVSAMQITGLPAIADDSGLCVNALDGAPGVYSARFAGEHGDDDANNQKLLKVMENVKDEDRTAYFESSVVLIFPNGDEIHAQGRCHGKIGYELSGDGGFGYDPLFYVNEKSLAQVSAQEKDAISHRGEALRILSDKLKEYFNVK